MKDQIVVAGDWHGNGDWAVKIVDKTASLGLDRIIQVGDFGLWDHEEKGIKFLDQLNETCRRTGVKVYWLDGNHENFDRLDWYVANNPKTKLGHVYIRSHVLYSPRGLRWNWCDKWFTTVGGAVSIDKHSRVGGKSWWPGEELTPREVNAIREQSDYLFTHDCPTSAPMRFLVNDPDSHIHRQRMNEVGRIIQPKIWFHGHMHDKYVYDFRHQKGYADVFGLEEDNNQFSWGVLDIPSGKFEWTPWEGVGSGIKGN